MTQPYTPADLTTAQTVFRAMVEQRDERFDVADFLSLCIEEADMESLAHDAMEHWANETGGKLTDAEYIALTKVCEDWQESGGLCAVCDALTARTELIGGGPQAVCSDEHAQQLEVAAQPEGDEAAPAIATRRNPRSGRTEYRAYPQGLEAEDGGAGAWYAERTQAEHVLAAATAVDVVDDLCADCQEPRELAASGELEPCATCAEAVTTCRHCGAHLTASGDLWESSDASLWCGDGMEQQHAPV